jgi:DNA mismatch repair protein MutS2
MKLFPDSATVQLEFDKIKDLLSAHCRSQYAKEKAGRLRIHTKIEFIEAELRQAFEYKQLLQTGVYFPADPVFNLEKELKLLALPGAVLGGDQLLEIKKMARLILDIFRWFDAERKQSYGGLASITRDVPYEKAIEKMIDEVLDETGQVKDNASDELYSIRMNLYRKRNELRRVFDKIVSRLNKQGWLADIEESLLNSRRVLAVHAEQKRTVKGILHGESESRRTAYIEPEETIELNNDIFSLESDEKREVYRLLRDLTAKLSVHVTLLNNYHYICGEYDFIRAKAKLAQDINGEFPLVQEKPGLQFVEAFHPLLYLYNKKAGKETIPVSLTLDDSNRILVISGPNAGGKTVTLKTVGLLQLMVQCGLLVPAHPSSRFGVFKQLLIHIGDTQSLEFELSTYSSHLKNMKYFMEEANGRTLFFIDELGSGSDPSLGGAFAEVILGELVKKHSYGIVTTHYLNLKVMAGKTPGIINGAMAFDEKHLQPLYKLTTGKPGSSYTFAIAERIGLNKNLIDQARKLVDEGHFRLDKLLNRAEQDLRTLEHKEKELHRLLQENEKLKNEMKEVMNRERHNRQVELLKQQNKLNEEKLIYLKETERKLKQMIIDWRKEEDKSKVIKNISALLFNKTEKKTAGKMQKQVDSKYEELPGEIKAGEKVKVKKNYQVGQVLELRGKKALVKIGLLPMQVDIKELVLVKEKISGPAGK